MKALFAGVLALALLACSGPSGGSQSGDEVAPPATQGASESALPGGDLAEVEPSAPAEDEGAVRQGMKLVGHAPLTGRFAKASAFGTDLAFKGKYAIVGNYEGFTVYDISKPQEPQQVAQVNCPGAQNDVAVYRDLLILSVDDVRSNDTCRSRRGDPTSSTSWEGIRVFDLANPAKPRFITSVATECGSHTHTLAPSRDGRELFVYVSSYDPFPGMHNCTSPHDKISVVNVPLKAPQQAAVVATPVLFPDGGLADTSGCHDITAYPDKDIAAGACMGDGILLDISDRVNPVVLDQVTDDENFAFWHSATFNNDGTKVIFTDELSGGVGPMCSRRTGMKRGADAVYEVVNNKLQFRSYYKMPRIQADSENCVAHNGSLIPVKGRDIMVQAWYQGGASVWDFTDPRNPRELAFYDPEPLSQGRMGFGGSWSAYWYNGYVYSSDITRGLEVFKITRGWAKEAAKVKMSVFNAQTQPSFNG